MHGPYKRYRVTAPGGVTEAGDLYEANRSTRKSGRQPEATQKVDTMKRLIELAAMLVLSVPLALMGCKSSVQLGPQAVAGLTPDGTVNMDQVQVAYLASAGGGSGTLYYQGAAYPFSVGGLGVGGIGASHHRRRGWGL